jgi:hypothetical protein
MIEDVRYGIKIASKQNRRLRPKYASGRVAPYPTIRNTEAMMVRADLVGLMLSSSEVKTREKRI